MGFKPRRRGLLAQFWGRTFGHLSKEIPWGNPFKIGRLKMASAFQDISSSSEIVKPKKKIEAVCVQNWDWIPPRTCYFILIQGVDIHRAIRTYLRDLSHMPANGVMGFIQF